MKKSNSKKEAKINKKNSCYKKNNENSNNNSSSTTEEEKAELLNQIGILDLSLFGVYLIIYASISSQTGDERNEKEIENAYKSVIAILLILLGTTINFEVLHS